MNIERRLSHTRLWFVVLTLLTAALLAGAVFYSPNYYEAEAVLGVHAEVTLQTTRLSASNGHQLAIAVAQNIYPSTFNDNRPNAVLLVPDDDWQSAILAAQLIHFPINAPILFAQRDRIPKETLKEIERLDPEGLSVDRNIKVLLVGQFQDDVLQELRMENINYRHLTGETPAELAAVVDDYKALIHVDHDDQVLLVPMNNPEYALLATSWVAHAGHTILFSGPDALPEATRYSLDRRPQDAYIYLLGTDTQFSAELRGELSKYGHVQKIPGANPFEMSVGFAGYKDFGPNFGWWIRRTTRNFGWGIAEAGHNFIFVTPEFVTQAIPAAALSHKGKHGPFLMVKSNEIPSRVQDYLQTVQPIYTGPQEQLFNHGWILGDEGVISNQVQQEIDQLLAVKRNE